MAAGTQHCADEVMTSDQLHRLSGGITSATSGHEQPAATRLSNVLCLMRHLWATCGRRVTLMVPFDYPRTASLPSTPSVIGRVPGVDRDGSQWDRPTRTSDPSAAPVACQRSRYRLQVWIPPWSGTAVVTGPKSGVTFRAWRNEESVPLIEVLLVLGRWILGAHWRLNDVEFAAGWRGSESLNLMSSHALPTPTVALVDLVSDGVQMIGGELQAFGGPGSGAPYLVIRSIRGDEWDIMSDDERVLEAVREVFEAVTDIPR